MTTELTKYAFGGLAGRFLQSEESKQYTTGALDVFADKYITEEAAKIFVQGAYANQESIETTARIASNKFTEEMFKVDGTGLADWYNTTLEGLPDGVKEKYTAILKSHGTKTLKQIQDALINAEYTLKAPEGRATEEERVAAKAEADKYAQFMNIRKILDEYKMEEFRPEAVNAFRKRNLKDLTSKL